LGFGTPVDNPFASLKELWEKGDRLQGRIFCDVTFEHDHLRALEEELAPLRPASANYEATYDVQHVKNRIVDTVIVSHDDHLDIPPEGETIPLPATVSVLDFRPLQLPQLLTEESIILVRDEYRKLLQILEDRYKGSEGVLL
jgi:hypothetical protein